MHRIAIVLTALAALLAQTGCDLEGYLDSDRYREDFQYSYDLKPGGSITLDNFNGSVEILGWEKDSVQITGTKHAGAQADLKEMRIEAAVTGNSLHIRTVRPESRRGNMGARYFLRVPRRVELERIASSNGAIRVEDVQGGAHLATSNGAIRLSKVAGRLEVRTSNGAIEADDLSTEASLRTSNGAIRVGRLSGSIDASTSNGSINVRVAKPAAGQPLKLRSSNGSIELDLQALDGNDVRASTSNASITVRLPGSARARVNARTSHGGIQSDFDVRAQGGDEKNQLLGDIGGSGGPSLELSTSHGAIRILKL